MHIFFDLLECERASLGEREKAARNGLGSCPFIRIKCPANFEHGAGQENIARRISNPLARRIPKGVKAGHLVAPPQRPATEGRAAAECGNSVFGNQPSARFGF